ncbi:kinase-like protein [Gigaspora margarita]|uniref:Kinase-like protein n=1 Tax=Gigaspora margarita TaxID=4874 RepID=A0A8H4AKD8_GIGMA|nr:kinase-like protein [Gigaspora margarita]
MLVCRNKIAIDVSTRFTTRVTTKVSYVTRTSVLRQYDIGEQIASSRLRHLSLLEIVEVVEESITVIIFATEPILASLANLLGNTKNLSTVPDDIKNFDQDELKVF